MEQRIGNQQQSPHYYRTEPSLFPSSNNGRSSSGYPLRRHNLPDLQSSFYPPIHDQSLEAAFSSLNLSPAPPWYPAGLDPNFVGEGLLPSDQQQSNNNVSLRSLRFQDGQTGSGMGPRSPTVGPEGFLLRSPPPAAAVVRDSWLYGDDMSLVSGVYDFDYFLNLKEQCNSYYPNTLLQSPMQSLNQSSNSLSVDSRRLNNQLQSAQQFNFLNLNDFKGRIVSLAKDQHWSRVLQAKFSDPTQEQIEMVLSEVIDYIGDLMNNQFGNYFVQKLIDVCTEEQRDRIILSVTTNFQLLSICLNPYGTRGVQKLMDNLSSPQQVSLLMAVLSPAAATLANDQNGHHVIQYCLTHFSAEDNMLLLNNIADNCYTVATNRNGCCVLQICMENSKGKPRERLVSEIIAIALHLSENPYGNYVLQHILGLKEPDIMADLLRQLEGNYMSISCNKYGSNVAEKCLNEAGEEQTTRIIMELVRNPNASMILLDPFGNYVIQSALAVSKGLARKALLHLVRANVSSMRSNLYGKKVLAFLEKKKIQLG